MREAAPKLTEHLTRLSTSATFREKLARAREVALDRCISIDVDRTYPDVFREVLTKVGEPTYLPDEDIVALSKRVSVASAVHNHEPLKPPHLLEEIDARATSHYLLEKSGMYERMGLLFSALRCADLACSASAALAEEALDARSVATARLGLMIADGLRGLTKGRTHAPVSMLKNTCDLLTESSYALEKTAHRSSENVVRRALADRVAQTLESVRQARRETRLPPHTVTDKAGRLSPTEYLASLPVNLVRIPTPQSTIDAVAKLSPALAALARGKDDPVEQHHYIPGELLNEIASGLDRRTRRLVRERVAAREILIKEVRAGVRPPNDKCWGHAIVISFGLSMFVHTAVELAMSVAETTPWLLLPGESPITAVKQFPEVPVTQ